MGNIPLVAFFGLHFIVEIFFFFLEVSQKAGVVLIGYLFDIGYQRFNI